MVGICGTEVSVMSCPNSVVSSRNSAKVSTNAKNPVIAKPHCFLPF